MNLVLYNCAKKSLQLVVTCNLSISLLMLFMDEEVADTTTGILL